MYTVTAAFSENIMAKVNPQPVAIVTGAAGVLGRAVSVRLAQQGARLAMLDVSPIPAHEGALALSCDLLDSNACTRALQQIQDTLGAPEILVNVAGGFAMADIVNADDDVWEFLMDINVKTMLNMCRATVPAMLANAGLRRIINIGAVAGLQGAAAMGIYSASKAAVIRLTESLSAELKAQGVNVNCVLPSIIDTARNRADMPSADYSTWVAPESLAAVIAFLASADAVAVHGAAIPVTGLS